MQAHGNGCKIMKLYAKSWNCITALGSVCYLKTRVFEFNSRIFCRKSSNTFISLNSTYQLIDNQLCNISSENNLKSLCPFNNNHKRVFHLSGKEFVYYSLNYSSCCRSRKEPRMYVRKLWWKESPLFGTKMDLQDIMTNVWVEHTSEVYTFSHSCCVKIIQTDGQLLFSRFSL